MCLLLILIMCFILLSRCTSFSAPPESLWHPVSCVWGQVGRASYILTQPPEWVKNQRKEHLFLNIYTIKIYSDTLRESNFGIILSSSTWVITCEKHFYKKVHFNLSQLVKLYVRLCFLVWYLFNCSTPHSLVLVEKIYRKWMAVLFKM